MRYFDKTFFKFLVVFTLIIFGGLFYLSKITSAQVLININAAPLEELDTLEGIGPTYAQRIIDYRTANGPFSQIEEIKNVAGIGDATYEKIKDDITVGSSQSSNQDSQTQNSNTNITYDISYVNENSSASGLNLQKGMDYKITVDKEKVGSVGSPVEFRAKHNIDDKRVSITWTFGDGSVAYGQNVSHTYKYPGEYVAVVSANVIDDRITARTNVSIVPNTLAVTHASPERIEITNTGKTEISLNSRQIISSGRIFSFPEDTIIKGGQKISFSSETTGLYPTSFGEVSFINAGETIAAVPNLTQTERVSYNKAKEEELIQQIVSLQNKQMELKNKESLNNLTSVVAAIEPEVEEKSTEVKKKTWLGTLKKFFGFK